ncbi:hypothetical protein PPERSA_00871 [Pseudocohnilembus persalinus]|uniref:Uncharacterized protein n=1 Tax=Pseudocohnilembus persalinus TaxID=266149 RepID=A0A0V0QEN1_PSEPJ|nr:hypothetical protein PPERSA_00871 [Pseudocohnilembus persalinus]|eukprot:KRX00644.1 hypothetical protein PPERSA_00871 [Pseudocohnilembus persalinus]
MQNKKIANQNENSFKKQLVYSLSPIQNRPGNIIHTQFTPKDQQTFPSVQYNSNDFIENNTNIFQKKQNLTQNSYNTKQPQKIQYSKLNISQNTYKNKDNEKDENNINDNSSQKHSNQQKQIIYQTRNISYSIQPYSNTKKEIQQDSQLKSTYDPSNTYKQTRKECSNDSKISNQEPINQQYNKEVYNREKRSKSPYRIQSSATRASTLLNNTRNNLDQISNVSAGNSRNYSPQNDSIQKVQQKQIQQLTQNSSNNNGFSQKENEQNTYQLSNNQNLSNVNQNVKNVIRRNVSTDFQINSQEFKLENKSKSSEINKLKDILEKKQDEYLQMKQDQINQIDKIQSNQIENNSSQDQNSVKVTENSQQNIIQQNHCKNDVEMEEYIQDDESDGGLFLLGITKQETQTQNNKEKDINSFNTISFNSEKQINQKSANMTETGQFVRINSEIERKLQIINENLKNDILENEKKKDNFDMPEEVLNTLFESEDDEEEGICEIENTHLKLKGQKQEKELQEWKIQFWNLEKEYVNKKAQQEQEIEGIKNSYAELQQKMNDTIANLQQEDLKHQDPISLQNINAQINQNNDLSDKNSQQSSRIELKINNIGSKQFQLNNAYKEFEFEFIHEQDKYKGQIPQSLENLQNSIDILQQQKHVESMKQNLPINNFPKIDQDNTYLQNGNITDNPINIHQMPSKNIQDEQQHTEEYDYHPNFNQNDLSYKSTDISSPQNHGQKPSQMLDQQVQNIQPKEIQIKQSNTPEFQKEREEFMKQIYDLQLVQ